MPSTPLTPSRALVRTALEAGLEWLLNEGFVYVHECYLPSMLALDAHAKSAADHRLAARGWYMLGELRQLVDAPHAAIEAYFRCLKHAPDSAEAWAEIARMHAALGQARKAAEAISEAKRRAPEHDETLDDMLYWETARYRDGSPTLAAAEALAAGDGAQALSHLNGRGTEQVRRWRACAYGVLGDLDALVGEWQSLCRGRSTVSIGYADWFYLPATGWQRADLWDALRTLGNRLDEEAVFPLDDSIAGARGLREAEKAMLSFERRAAEARGDAEALAAMCRARPRWREAREALRALEAGRSAKRRPRGGEAQTRA